LSTKFFAWDLKLYDAERDIPASTNTSDVNEELGLITHLFTDKTGSDFTILVPPGVSFVP
jgi:hypothetical protein